MDDHDRRSIINALDRESEAQQQRILDTLNSFRNWIQLVLQLIYRKIQHELSKLWSWLRGMW